MALFFGSQNGDNNSKKGKLSSVFGQINNAIKDVATATLNTDKMSSAELCTQGINFLKQGDTQKALKMFMAGAYRLDTACMMQLHDMYANGTHINKDATRAWFWARLSGENGDAQGDYYTGLYYYNGIGVEKDINKAWAYFERAARKGHQDAERYYGEITYEPPHMLDAVLSPEEKEHFNQITFQNINSLKSEPTSYLRCCMYYANHSDRTNMKNLLGLCYLEGFGTAVDYISAQQWFKVDCRAGNQFAMWNLAKLYALGKGLLMNTTDAISLLDSASQQGHKASAERANLYRSRLSSTPDMLNQKARSLNMVGENAPNNFSKEMEFYYYFLAAQKNDLSACQQVAYKYFFQRGVKRDYNEALYYIGKSMLLHKITHNTNALTLENRILSHMYAFGLGVAKNPALSNQYFQEAQSTGEYLQSYSSITDYFNKAQAAAHTKNVYEEAGGWMEGLYGLPDAERAIDCYKFCISRNHVSSYFDLIRLYTDGYSVPRNPAEAKKYALQYKTLCNTSENARKLRFSYNGQICGVALNIYNELEFHTCDTLTGQMAMHAANLCEEKGLYDLAWFCYEAASIRGVADAMETAERKERIRQREAEARARAEQEQREAAERARLEQEQREAEERARLEQEQREAEERARLEQETTLSPNDNEEADDNEAPLYDSWLAIKKEVDCVEVQIPAPGTEAPRSFTLEEFATEAGKESARIEEALRDPKRQNAQLSAETPALTDGGSYDREMTEIRQLVSDKDYDNLHDLGLKYADADNREYNPRLAVTCFKLAMQHGNLNGLISLAECFANDTGVPMDLTIAKKIFQRLLELNSPQLTEYAQEAIGAINEYLRTEPETYEEMTELGGYYERIAQGVEIAHYPEEEWLIYEYYRMSSYKKGKNGMIMPKYHDKYYAQRVNWEQVLEMPWEMYIQGGSATPDVAVSALSTSTEDGMPENLDHYFAGMIGMEPVKDQLDKIYQTVKMQLLREQILRERGVSVAENEKGYNFILLGNPGTGKTTVARIIAQILYDIKVRKSNSFLEIERSKVVSDHIGGTENRMREILEKVDGGTLFIDEAYSLYKEDSDNDFGQEAIDVLMKDMEDHRNSYSVIMAGYKEPMMNMIKNANSGFSSRFTYFIELPDYSDDALIEIAHKHIEKQKFVTEAEVDQAIKKCINHDKIDHTFGNARYIRELVNRAIENQSHRLTKQGSYDTDELFLLKAIDFWQGNMEEDVVSKYLAELNALTGLQEVKEEVNSLIKQITVQKELERRGMPSTMDFGTMHMAFKGNPGTGKTTVARIIGKLYTGLGILKRGDVFVECSRADLVEMYQGQTAKKVKKVVESALGGILFVDEAYSLVQGEGDSFGHEAVDTLVAEMENNRKNLVVIFAGYSDDLNEFFKNNQGLRSRVPKDLYFADYDLNELYDIALSMIQAKNLLLSQEAEEALRASLLRNSMMEDFGNARGVRNIVDAIYRKQNVRVAKLLSSSDTEISNEALLTILPEDID